MLICNRVVLLSSGIWAFLSGQSQSLGGRVIFKTGCRSHTKRNYGHREGRVTPSDTEKSSFSKSVSLSVQFLSLRQLNVWQLPYFVCLSEEVLFFYLLLESTLESTCCEVYLGAGHHCSRSMEKNLHVIITWWEQPELFEVEGTGAECLFFISYPIVLVFPCQLSLTVFAVVLYIIHRLHLHCLPVFDKQG